MDAIPFIVAWPIAIVVAVIVAKLAQSHFIQPKTELTKVRNHRGGRR